MAFVITALAVLLSFLFLHFRRFYIIEQFVCQSWSPVPRRLCGTFILVVLDTSTRWQQQQRLCQISSQRIKEVDSKEQKGFRMTLSFLDCHEQRYIWKERQTRGPESRFGSLLFTRLFIFLRIILQNLPQFPFPGCYYLKNSCSVTRAKKLYKCKADRWYHLLQFAFVIYYLLMLIMVDYLLCLVSLI